MTHHKEAPTPSDGTAIATIAIIVVMVVLGVAIGVHAVQERRHERELTARYQAGVEYGLSLKRQCPEGFVCVTEADWRKLPLYKNPFDPKTIIIRERDVFGPLDLRGFTADQVKRLHCYLEDKPSDRLP